MKIALVTSEALPDLYPDDQLLAESLRRRGASVMPAVWSDPAVRWSEYAGSVLRSTWDYHRRIAEFRRWVDRLEQEGQLFNAPTTVRWNSDKRYLADLADRGIPIVPTVWGREVRAVSEVLRARRWELAVLKPTVSANAERTYRIAAADVERNEALFRELSASGEVMLQPYLRGVESPGERSLVLFDGRFSHAVLRRPKLAGKTDLVEGTPTTPSPAEVSIAVRAVEAVRPLPLYARVDLVPSEGGTPCLAELELIEPLLYLGSAAGAAERFAEAIERRLATTISRAGS
jgi:glutathione synthase/RimK-type ligase-like ATP-grasp enzyme